MSEPKPKVKKEDGDTTEKTRSKPQYHQCWNKNRDQGGERQEDRIATPRINFKGEFPESEGAYFEFSTGYRADMYETSIRLMIRYVARKYDNGDNIKMILNKLKMPTLEKPEALDSIADNMDKDLYIEDVNTYVKYNLAITRSAKSYNHLS